MDPTEIRTRSAVASMPVRATARRLPVPFPLTSLFGLLLSIGPPVGGALGTDVGAGSDEMVCSAPEEASTKSAPLPDPDKLVEPGISPGVTKGMNAVTVGFTC